MSVNLEPVVFLLRFYGEGKSFDNKDAYEAVATVSKFGNKAYIQGLQGSMTRSQYAQLFVELAEHGIEYLFAERSGKERYWNVNDMLQRMKIVSVAEG